MTTRRCPARRDDPHRSRLPVVPIAVALLVLGASACERDTAVAPAIEPPSIAFDRLETALARRLRERVASVQAAPQSAEAWGFLGVALDVHEMFPEAVPCYEQAAALDPGDDRWPYFLGLCTSMGDPAASLALFRRAAELRPGYAPTHFRIGHQHLLRNEYDEAAMAFGRALELDDGFVAARLGSAKVALARGDAAAARGELTRALEQGAVAGEVHALLAEAYRRLGDETAAGEHDAIAGIDWAPEPVPDPMKSDLWWTEGVTLEWRRTRGRRYAARGELDKFVAEWRAAMDDDPSSAEPHLELAAGYVFIGKLDDALASCDRALEIEPGSARAHSERGTVLSRLGRGEEATVAFRRALEIDPDMHEARGNLGGVLVQLGRIDEGLTELREACRRLPNNATAHFNLAAGLLAKKETSEAREELATVLAIDPDHAQAYFQLGLLAANDGNMDEATARFRRVVDLSPRRASAYMNLARAQLQAGRPADSVLTYREGLTHLPRHEGLLGPLAWILATSPDDSVRDGKQAVAVAQRLNAINDFANPYHLDIMAAAAAEAGDFDVAVHYATKAIESLLHPAGPGTEEQWRRDRLQGIQDRLGLYEAALPFRAPG